MSRIMHIAIPCGDPEQAKAFYGGVLGCRVAREYEDRITVDFFGMQLVCHLSPDKIEAKPEMYPRHFGVTFHTQEDFERTLDRLTAAGAPFFTNPFTRFPGKKEEHRSFFLKDPSNNVIEFKWYRDREMMY